VSAFLLIEPEYRERSEIEVDYDLDVEIYKNFFNETDEIKLSEVIINHIDRANHEIHIAMYSFNHQAILDALERASDRGVKVTIFYNIVNNAAFNDLIADVKDKFNIIYIGKFRLFSNYVMHHKFMIVDPYSPEKVLLTGPWNWSYLQEDIDPNILLKITDE
jgi:phosphatidylserine/phosphatidylglycerophosphate/cardiolipin synthase-like enzyme